MTQSFDNSGPGEQNIAQGDHAIGRQENTGQDVGGDGNIFSGTGNVTVNQGLLRVKPRTVLLGAGLAAVLLGAGLAGWHWLAPPPVQTNSIVIKDNKQSGPTAIAQGAGATVNQTNNSYNGVPYEEYRKLGGQLDVTDAALTSFFKILEEQKVPRADLDSKLREIAAQYKELLTRLDSVQSEDPQVVKLKQEAKQAIEAGNYAKAEELLNQAETLDLKAIEQMEKTAKQRRISAAATNADQAKLQELQLRYAKAAEYWQKAAALLPEEEKKDRAYYLNAAGEDLYRIAKYKEALPLFEQSLAIDQEIGDKAGEGTTLNNISQIYDAKGDYGTALKYLEQSLAIRKEIGDKAGEAVTSWNIGMIYKAQGDLAKAEQYMSRTVQLDEEIGHPDLEKDREALEQVRAKLRGK